MWRIALHSRRQFLKTVSVAAAAGAALPIPSGAEDKQDKKPLPPAISALRSRRTDARPISLQEQTDRQEKARRLMQENNLDAILLAQGTSLRYFTGIRWEGGERLFAMVLPAKGDAFFVSPAFEEDRAREQIALGPNGNSADLRVWQED